MTNALRWQTPFDGKCHSKAKGKIILILRSYEGTGKDALKRKAIQWQKFLRRQTPFDSKGHSMANANGLRWQRKEHFEGKVPRMAKAK
jgi:hypothetical protein